MNKPKSRLHQADNCLILHHDYQDFLKILKDNSVDLALTDPPYVISKETGFKKIGKNSVKRFAVNMEFGDWDLNEIDLVTLSKELYRVLRSGGTAIIWYDIWKISYLQRAMLDAGFKMLRLLIWEKNNPVPLNMRATYLSNSREIAVVGVKGGRPTFHSSYDNGIYQAPIPRHGGKRAHPTQKPLDLFCQLINKHSNEGDLVIDPFLGSGTTALAALMTDRKFAGGDINKNYVRQAQRRIDNYYQNHG